MIRSFIPSDLPDVIRIVQAGKKMTTQEISDRLNSTRAFLCDDGTIKGCLAVATPVDSPEGKRLTFWLYTDPVFRCQGIGSQLWQALQPVVQEHSPDLLITGHTPSPGTSREFFAKRGLNRWLSSHLMHYSGPSLSACELRVENYSDGYFEWRLTTINEGFYELRRVLGYMSPECHPPSDFTNEELRREMLADSSNVFIFFAGEEPIGLALIGPNYIDDVVVVRSQRGRSYGRQIMHYCINHLKERGVDTIALGVLDHNLAARRLYESMGFRYIEEHEMALQDFTKKAHL